MFGSGSAFMDSMPVDKFMDSHDRQHALIGFVEKMLRDALANGQSPTKQEVIDFADKQFDTYIAPLMTSTIPPPFNAMAIGAAKLLLNLAVSRVYDRVMNEQPPAPAPPAEPETDL